MNTQFNSTNFFSIYCEQEEGNFIEHFPYFWQPFFSRIDCLQFASSEPNEKWKLWSWWTINRWTEKRFSLMKLRNRNSLFERSHHSYTLCKYKYETNNKNKNTKIVFFFLYFFHFYFRFNFLPSQSNSRFKFLLSKLHSLTAYAVFEHKMWTITINNRKTISRLFISIWHDFWT